MQRLRIYIDPMLQHEFGPQICWTFRVLLSGIGYTWEEVTSKNSDVDIAYVTSLEQSPRCHLCISANLENWRKMSSLQLHTIGNSQGITYPLYMEENALSSIFHTHNSCLICERDIIFDVFWLVSGQGEKHLSKDKKGFFNLNESQIAWKRVFQSAVVSNIGSGLESRIRNLGFTEPVPRWPHQKKAAVCFTHDVDYPEIKRLLGSLRIIMLKGLNGVHQAVSVLAGAKTNWHFQSWVKMEKDLGVRSAFFFVPRKGSVLQYAFGVPDPFYDVSSKRFKELFRYLTAEGVEIGLHSSYGSCQSEVKFSNERKILQHASGQDIYGNRHHYWHLNPDDTESTLLLHEKIGIKYDMSLAHERYIGWRRGSSWPHFPFYQAGRRELKTLQISTTWMDDHLFGYLHENPGDRHVTLRTLVNETVEQEGCFVANIHNYVFDDVLYPGMRKTYFWLLKHLVEHSDFWIATPNEIADHWKKRYVSILRESEGLTSGLGGNS
jgi:hypothetical protein